jgi:hypothetical protein
MITSFSLKPASFSGTLLSLFVRLTTKISTIDNPKNRPKKAKMNMKIWLRSVNSIAHSLDPGANIHY